MISWQSLLTKILTFRNILFILYPCLNSHVLAWFLQWRGCSWAKLLEDRNGRRKLEIRQAQRRQGEVTVSGASLPQLLHSHQRCNRVPEDALFCCHQRPLPSLFGLPTISNRKHKLDGSFTFLDHLRDEVCCEEGLFQDLLDERQSQYSPCSLVVLLQDLC